MRIGIDVGGAFTDLVAYDDVKGDIVWVKVETTPDDPSRGVIDAIKRSKVNLADVVTIVGHGQTVVINSIITRTGAKVGLITTKGYRDVLLLQRANRRDVYNFVYKKPEPFVPRYLTFEVEERILSDGSEYVQLNRDQLKEVAKKLITEKVESICISFLNSYVNPIHEIEARDVVLDVLNSANAGEIPITLSHEVTMQWGEYERTNTAVLNSFVKPKMKSYLSNLENEIRNMGFKGKFFSILSNGGIASFNFVKDFPIFAVESGPIAGIMGGIEMARIVGEKNVIVLDGGSTTTKAGLVENLTQKVSSEYNVNRSKFNPGYPLKVPVTEIEEVGNGGTSVAWIDDVGNLRVGPFAAGAFPGPVCYGKGGDKVTVTDAYVVNGLVNPDYFLGGQMKIYRDKAISAIKENIASKFGISVEEAADGIIRIANENASDAIRIVSVQKGYDPREFTLIAHGGSGPMFAPFIANELEMNKIIVPSIPPGVFSAWGMLIADVRHDLIATNVLQLTGENIETIDETFKRLDSSVLDLFHKDEGIQRENVVLRHFSDMRYKGQEHTVKVEIDSLSLGESDIVPLIKKFHSAHEKEYNFRLENSPVEMINYHVVGVSKIEKPVVKERKFSKDDGTVEKGSRKLFIGGEVINSTVYDRKYLPIDYRYRGPAVIEDPTSTVIVLKNQEFWSDKFGNVIIRKVI
ncbi:MAG: hydantoinase/oxoprolinase family protein [Nitrososphaerota archaeon]